MIATSRAPVRLFWNDHNRWEWLGRVALVGLAAGAVLAIAGLPPVDVHGPLHYVGIMDPLCGGTRGLRLMMRGHLASAWRDNPAGRVPAASGGCRVGAGSHRPDYWALG